MIRGEKRDGELRLVKR